MCGRYYIPDDGDFDDISTMLSRIRELYKDSPLLPSLKLGEIFPSDIVPVITESSPELMKWGFTGFDGKRLIINARIETVQEKAMFRKSFAEKRCLIPAGAYFEWRKDGGRKQKYAIRQHQPIYMAGFYCIEEPSQLPLFVIMTRPALPELAFIHERMPVIIPKQECRSWLKGDLGSRELSELSPGSFDFEGVG